MNAQSIARPEGMVGKVFAVICMAIFWLLPFSPFVAIAAVATTRDTAGWPRALAKTGAMLWWILGAVIAVVVGLPVLFLLLVKIGAAAAIGKVKRAMRDLESSNPTTRHDAAITLGTFTNVLLSRPDLMDQARPRLMEMMKDDDDEQVRAGAMVALDRITRVPLSRYD